MPKDERLEVRVSQADRELIDEAAELLQETISDFIRSAATVRARRALARSDVTLMPAEQFDALMQSLDQPDETPKLASVFAKPRCFRRE